MTEEKEEKTIRYFSMFSGIGGFECGMEQSKYEFKNVGFSEVNEYAISIYLKNFPEHRNYGDATKIDTETLPDFDLLVGGFPCQSFSVSGKRRGFDDTRGTLFFEIARVLRDKRPRYFLLENVTGLLGHNKGKTFQTILRVLDEVGYDVQWEVYNSQNFGTAQRRERVFLKGYFRGKCGYEILHQEKKIERNNLNVNKRLIQVNNGKKTNQSSRIYSCNGLSVCLNATGNNGWYVLDEELEQEIKEKNRKM